MGPLAVGEAVVGGLLVFVLPGFTTAKALFPERRVRGPDGVRWALELAAISLVVSVVLTVVVGYLLLVAAPGGFSASWSDPLLEAALGAISVVAFVAGGVQGAYAREPRRPVGSPEPSADPWELDRQLDRLQRERLRLERALRRSASSDAEGAARLRQRIGDLAQQEEALKRGREAEYDL